MRGVADIFDEVREEFARDLFEATNKPKYKVGDSVGVFKVKSVDRAIGFEGDKTDYKNYYYTYVLINPETLDTRGCKESELDLLL